MDPVSLPPTTTIEQDKVIYAQQRVNLIWERTQAVIAIYVVVFSLAVAGVLVIANVYYGRPPQELPNVFSLLLGTVIGFYFSRTNHSSIGGIGPKANQDQEYKGR